MRAQRSSSRGVSVARARELVCCAGRARAAEANARTGSRRARISVDDAIHSMRYASAVPASQHSSPRDAFRRRWRAEVFTGQMFTDKSNGRLESEIGPFEL